MKITIAICLTILAVATEHFLLRSREIESQNAKTAVSYELLQAMRRDEPEDDAVKPSATIRPDLRRHSDDLRLAPEDR